MKSEGLEEILNKFDIIISILIIIIVRKTIMYIVMTTLIVYFLTVMNCASSLSD